MKQIKRLITFFLVSTILLTMASYAQATENIGSFSDDQLYHYLMQKTESDFLESATEICLEEHPSQLTVVGVALFERNDISNDELVQLVIDKNEPYYLRRIAVECYALRQPASIDNRVREVIADESEANDLRMIAVSLLADYMGSSDVPLLITTSNASDDNLAYNSIKALERVSPKAAICIAASIYDNYETETPARINIAAKVLSRSLESSDVQSITASTVSMTEEDFLERSAVIFNSTQNDEIRCAISTATAHFSSEEAAALTVTPRATGKQGYAAYRDGVTSFGVELNWHTAIIKTGSSTSDYVFAHAAGSGSTTGTTNYAGFLGDGDPQGYYRPSSTTLTSSQRDAVCGTATELANERLGYVFTQPIRYSIASATPYKHPISEIVAIRCDGFVEYAYEYNDIRVYGDDTYWNISRTGESYMDEHGGFQLTPRKQANDYMVRLGSL